MKQQNRDYMTDAITREMLAMEVERQSRESVVLWANQRDAGNALNCQREVDEEPQRNEGTNRRKFS